MTIKKEMVVRKLGADTILIPMGDALKEHNGLFMLSETACFLWEQLPTCNSVEELANKLYDEYDVTNEQAFIDTKEFVNMLVKLDIIDI